MAALLVKYCEATEASLLHAHALLKIRKVSYADSILVVYFKQIVSRATAKNKLFAKQRVQKRERERIK